MLNGAPQKLPSSLTPYASRSWAGAPGDAATCKGSAFDIASRIASTAPTPWKKSAVGAGTVACTNVPGTVFT
jgi:hypothetical protein